MTSTTLPRSELAGLSAVIEGAGRPVLLLHGVGLRAEAWDAQITALSRGYQVIAPDMPGHGHSPYPVKQPAAFAGFVQAALPLLEATAEPVLVVGHSMGAMIALELAALAPEKFCGAVALNAIFERTPEAAAAVQARAASLDGRTLPDPDPTLTRWFGATSSPERAACERWLRSNDPQGYKQAYEAFAQANGPSRQTLEALSCPALFATGVLEPNSTPEMSRAMASLAPDGRFAVIEGAAHMMPMTHAGEVNAALLSLAREIWP